MEAGTLAGALCGLVGVYVVLRRMSYIGHGLSHAIFGGAVASYVLQINFYVGAGIWGVVSALLINSVARRRKIGADAAIGIVTTASFAIGVALISRFHRFTVNFEAALFGNILGVSSSGLLVLAGATVFTVAAVFFQYRQLLFATFFLHVLPRDAAVRARSGDHGEVHAELPGQTANGGRGGGGTAVGFEDGGERAVAFGHCQPALDLGAVGGREAYGAPRTAGCRRALHPWRSAWPWR